MKKYLLVVSILLTCFSVKAQVLISLLFGDDLNTGKIEFGLDGGINYPDIRGIDGGSLQTNFNIGFYFDIKTSHPKWLVHTGVLVKSSLGTDGLPVYSLGNPDLDNAFAEGEVRRKINYFNVPIALKYKLSNRIFMEGGIMPALRSKAQDIFTSTVQGNDLEYRVDIGDKVHRLDFGLVGGVGYRLFKGYGMNLTARYYYGLTDIIIDDSTPNQYNTSIYLALGIPIGVGKAMAKKAAKDAEREK